MERDICRVFSLDRVRLPISIKSIVYSFLVLISNDLLRKHYLKGSRGTWKSFERISPVEAILRKKLIFRNLLVQKRYAILLSFNFVVCVCMCVRACVRALPSMTTVGYWVLYTKYVHAHIYIYKCIVCLPTKWEALLRVL